MWVGDMPVAETPLWQLAQLLVTPTWLNSAPPQLSVVWQASHSRSVTMCVGPLPCACTPLWQGGQPPPPRGGAKVTPRVQATGGRTGEHTSGLQSPCKLGCRLLLSKKNKSMYRP